MNVLYKILPICKYRTWGGNELCKQLRIPHQEENIGEIFSVCALPQDDCIVEGEHVTLSQFYRDHPAYFNLKLPYFPLRINLIDAQEDLSIQVHPSTSTKESITLPEAWLILKSNHGSIRYGHHWKQNEDYLQSIKNETIEKDIPLYPVKKNDFFYIKAGSVHAIGKGVMLYEITHQADITYRLYDYQRMDKKTGKQRVLQREQAGQAMYYPQDKLVSPPCSIINKEFGSITTYFDECNIFTLKKIIVQGTLLLETAGFSLLTIIEGSGIIQDTPVSIGETWLQICMEGSLRLEGNMELIMAVYRES